MKKNIKHIFFDLDRTLWDFDLNSKEVLQDLVTEFEVLNRCNTSFEQFHDVYKAINENLWIKYRSGEITKDELRSSRFFLSMKHFGWVDKSLGQKMEYEYISRSPYKTNLLPGTIDTLNKLKEKYQLHIITNGFKEVQKIKITHSGLESYFNEVIVSEEVGFNKPDKHIFNYAIDKVGGNVSETVMVGDDYEADIKGSEAVGMWAIFCNFSGGFSKSLAHDYEIKMISEITKFL